jgi:hypothetical protein
VLRSLKEDRNGAAIQPQLTIYGTSPVVEAKGKGTLVVERLDIKGERQQIELTGTQAKGRFYDFARTGKTLTAGGTYAATFGTSRIVFRVDAQARPGPTPIVGRLIRLE